MRDLPDDIVAAIGVLETAAAHLHALDRIIQWPDLNARQRVVALTIACLEHVNERPPGSLDLSRVCGLPPEMIEKVFEGLEHAPYYWSEIPETRSWAFLPSQKLEYGEA